ncbi:MAG: pyridoxal phosphate-dependent aminotransferase [bacterium]|nr:pyridoxal phosphate-dependent aminotransferase [bacterium]
MIDYTFAKRDQNVPNSGIGFMMRYASKYQDVVSLGQGTPLFPTPSFIYDELYKTSKINHEIGMYSSVKIEVELKKAIINQMTSIYGFTPDLKQIYLTIGGIGGLFAAFMSLIEKNDEIIYFDPSYPIHLSQIALTEAKPVFVSFDEKNKWKMDFEKLHKSITNKTKAILLTNPNNPTGTVLTKNEVKALSTIILKHNLILILDEAYDFLTYENKKTYSPLSLPELRDNIILCKSFSKEFAMTGWRIGYVFANEKLKTAIDSVHTYFCISPPTPSIIAATIALTKKEGKESKQFFIKKFTESRSAICERLEKLSNLFSFHKPDGAYYIFPKYNHFDLNAFDFAKMLVDEAKVITIPGSTMGPSGEGHVRMSFAADSTIIHKAFDQIDDFAKKHKLI